MTNRVPVLFAPLVIIFLTVASTHSQVKQQVQSVINEEVLAMSPPPACNFSFKVVEGKGLNSASISLLRSMGMGVKGISEGTGLPVRCNDVDGSGWIDSAGDLQAFIAPVKGWFFERTGNIAKPVVGKLHVITRSLPFDGKNVVATYTLYAGPPLGQFAVRLFTDLGIGIKSHNSTVLVRLENGQKQKGTLSATGAVTLLEEAWPN